MKRTYQRIFALLLTICLVAALSLSLSAADQKVTLKFEDNSLSPREVVGYSFRVEQTVNEEGQPTGTVTGGLLVIEVAPAKQATGDLCAWALYRNEKRDGELEMCDAKTGKTVKTIRFTDAYCVGYEEKTGDDGTVTELITLSAGQIVFENVTYQRSWSDAVPPEGSAISDGNTVVLIVCAVVAAAAIAVIVLVTAKRKKKDASAE